MEKVLLRAIWSTQENVFKLAFQPFGEGNEGLSSAYWDITSDKFLEMVEDAETKIAVKDGQSKIGKSNFTFGFVDKLGNDCEIALSNTNRSNFGELTAYLRKVYDSWCAWKAKNA